MEHNNIKRLDLEKNLGNTFKDIIDGMYDWVRVVDPQNNVIFMNKSMRDSHTCGDTNSKCYNAFGKQSPCENCISHKSIFHGQVLHKEEFIDGRTFSVMSSPVKNDSGEIIGAVEVLRDITHTKRLQQKVLEQNKKLQEDLNTAKKLQCSLLPKDLPEKKIKFSYLYRPCELLGGDFLDIFRIDEKHLGIYIADVSGHGVSASLLTVFLRSTINKKLLSPAASLEELYREYNIGIFDSDLYISVFYGIIDLDNNTMTYSNAGLNVCPVILNSNKLVLLRTPGVPISDWVEEPVYIDKTVQLEKSDRIFFYTDGIIEIRNRYNETFGEERVLDIIQNDISEPSAILNRLIDKACEFACINNVSEVSDDITMALLELID